MDSTRPPTEVVGKDREPQELPHAPSRLLEKRTGAGRPNGQPTSSRPHREPSIVGPRIHLCELPVTTNRQDVRRFMPALDRHLQPLYPAAYSHHRLWAQPEAAVATGRPTQVTRPVVLPLGPRGPEMHACRCSLPESVDGNSCSAGYWSRETANRHAGSNHPAVVER